MGLLITVNGDGWEEVTGDRRRSPSGPGRAAGSRKLGVVGVTALGGDAAGVGKVDHLPEQGHCPVVCGQAGKDEVRVRRAQAARSAEGSAASTSAGMGLGQCCISWLLVLSTSKANGVQRVLGSRVCPCLPAGMQRKQYAS